MSEQAKQLIEENLQTKNPYLDLGNCELDGTEPILDRLGEYNHLETLILSNLWEEFNLDAETWIVKKSKNLGKYNKLVELPKHLPISLKKIVISGWRNSYWSLTKLQSLSNLSNLIYLNCCHNSIKDLSIISEAVNLKELYCRSNYIQELDFIKKLHNLEILYCSDNKITNLDFTQNLTKLTKLYISFNQVKDLYPIKDSKELTELYCHENNIETIEPIKQLVALKKLDISNNKIQNLTALIPLKELQHLDCSKNYINSLQPIANLSNLETLHFEYNHIDGIPREILHSNTKNILNYLQSIEEAKNRRPLNEAKLIFVGVGEVGKTELAEALSEEANYTFEEGRATTKGIRIKKWSIKKGEADFTANIWDFAGQEINYGTHQFFLTKNSVYIFVWDTRKGEDQSKFHYWLNVVSLLSNHSPVFVVQNKIDIYKTQINRKIWKDSFENIVDFAQTSCKNGEGVDELRNLVKKALIELPNTAEIWNKDRFAVREILEGHEENYINHEEYLQVCEKQGVNEEDAGFLSQQLHDIGVILYFDDDLLLKETVVLKPEWATEAAYCLLDNQDETLIKNGKFEVKDLNIIWKDARFRSKQAFLLKIMERFELVFQLENTDFFIIPELLPTEAPPSLREAPISSLNSKKYLHFEYHYHFMPKGILSRFICRIHDLIQRELFWKYGVVLQYEGSQAKVTLNDVAAIKVIKIKTWGEQANNLLSIIRSHFEHIHQRLNNPPLDEKVPCICPTGCEYKTKPYLHNYRTLIKFQQKGRITRECEKSVAKVSISAMLEGIIDTQGKFMQDWITLINKNAFEAFFAEIDRQGIEDHHLSNLRKRYTHEGNFYQFAEQLKVWVLGYFKNHRDFREGRYDK
ncbi:MAG TPA: hypothetical protein DCS93_36670 [Microscillaceae bacterium]|nr:hypothetical protein [Microscillaceae bacterium]